MNLEVWLVLATKLIELFQQIDFSAPTNSPALKQIQDAKNLDDIHAAIGALRGQVTK